jgi:hypothetical protein
MPADRRRLLRRRRVLPVRIRLQQRCGFGNACRLAVRMPDGLRWHSGQAGYVRDHEALRADQFVWFAATRYLQLRAFLHPSPHAENGPIHRYISTIKEQLREKLVRVMSHTRLFARPDVP